VPCHRGHGSLRERYWRCWPQAGQAKAPCCRLNFLESGRRPAGSSLAGTLWAARYAAGACARRVTPSSAPMLLDPDVRGYRYLQLKAERWRDVQGPAQSVLTGWPGGLAPSRTLPAFGGEAQRVALARRYYPSSGMCSEWMSRRLILIRTQRGVDRNHLHQVKPGAADHRVVLVTHNVFQGAAPGRPRVASCWRETG